MIDESILKKDELAVFALRKLYSTHGYKKYKMRKFEEYDFYSENKDPRRRRVSSPLRTPTADCWRSSRTSPSRSSRISKRKRAASSVCTTTKMSTGSRRLPAPIRRSCRPVWNVWEISAARRPARWHCWRCRAWRLSVRTMCWIWRTRACCSRCWMRMVCRARRESARNGR